MASLKIGCQRELKTMDAGSLTAMREWKPRDVLIEARYTRLPTLHARLQSASSGSWLRAIALCLHSQYINNSHSLPVALRHSHRYFDLNTTFPIPRQLDLFWIGINHQNDFTMLLNTATMVMDNHGPGPEFTIPPLFLLHRPRFCGLECLCDETFKEKLEDIGIVR
jgi:hypothetical protein